MILFALSAGWLLVSVCRYPRLLAWVIGADESFGVGDEIAGFALVNLAESFKLCRR